MKQKKKKTTPSGEESIRYVCKPLASKGGRGLFPTVFVDISVEKCGPWLPRSAMVPDHDRPDSSKSSVGRGDVVMSSSSSSTKEEAALAASQWGSLTKEEEEKPWIKSWFFPCDAFDPWPEKANGTCCWHCTCEYDCAPFPLPRSRDETHGRWRVYAGGFCGPSCAKAYAKYTLQCSNLSNVFSWIDLIATKYFSYDEKIKIPIAPKKEVLQKYCGPRGLTIAQFRTMCTHGRTLKLHDPGFIALKQIVEGEDINASMKLANGTTRVCHRENPDDIKTVEELVTTKRAVFGGRSTRPISSFFNKRQ
jgi:hypothetical protein